MTLIYFFVGLSVFLFWNWRIIKKRSPNHAAQVVYRFVAWTLGASIFSGGDLRTFFTLLVAFHLAFWFPFDLILNLMRGLKWSYIGETAWLDKQGRKWPEAFQMFKLLFFITGIGYLIFPNG